MNQPQTHRGRFLLDPFHMAIMNPKPWFCFFNFILVLVQHLKVSMLLISVWAQIFPHFYLLRGSSYCFLIGCTLQPPIEAPIEVLLVFGPWIWMRMSNKRDYQNKGHWVSLIWVAKYVRWTEYFRHLEHRFQILWTVVAQFWLPYICQRCWDAHSPICTTP